MIFAHTQGEAKWVINYAKIHPRKQFKIIAPSLLAWKTLQDAGIYQNDYIIDGYHKPGFYYHNIHHLVKTAQKAVKYLRNAFLDLKVEDLLVFDILTTVIETEFTYALYAQQYAKYLEKIWKPSVYYVSTESELDLAGWDPKGFLLAALMGHFFLDKRKVKYFTPAKGFHFSDAFASISNYLSSISFLLLEKKYLLKSKFISRTTPPPKSKGGYLLFSAGRNLDHYHRMIDELNRHQISGIILTGSQSAAETYQLLLHGVSFIPLQNLFSLELTNKVMETEEKLKANWEKTVKSLFQNTSIKAKYGEVLLSAFCDRLNKIGHKYIPTVSRQCVLAEKALSIYQPRLVITTHDPGHSAVPFVLAAQKRRINTLTLLHGWTGMTLGANHNSDRIIVWGKVIAKWFTNYFRKNIKTIHLGGFPALDDLFLEKKAFWQTAPELPSKFRVLGILLTVDVPDARPNNFFLEQIFNAAAQTGFTGKLWVRTHRGQEITPIGWLAKKYGISLNYNPAYDLTQFIEKCDAVITGYTTATFWTLVMGKPVFVTTPLWGNGRMRLKQYRAAFFPTNAKYIFAKLTQLEKKPELLVKVRNQQKKYLRDTLGIIDGTAYRKTAEIIKNMLKTNAD